jgi:hypothetical protein
VRSWLAMAEKADQTTVPMWLGSDDSLHAVPVRAAICRGRRGAHRRSWPDPGRPELEGAERAHLATLHRNGGGGGEIPERYGAGGNFGESGGGAFKKLQ